MKKIVDKTQASTLKATWNQHQALKKTPNPNFIKPQSIAYNTPFWAFKGLQSYIIEGQEITGNLLH